MTKLEIISKWGLRTVHVYWGLSILSLLGVALIHAVNPAAIECNVTPEYRDPTVQCAS